MRRALPPGREARILYALYGENGYLAKTAHAGNFGTAGFIISTVAYAGIYKISGMEGLLITTVVMDIIAVVCSFFLRSESSKAVIADRKEVQILAIFKNKKAFLFVISLAIFSIAWLLINFFYVEKLENCGPYTPHQHQCKTEKGHDAAQHYQHRGADPGGQGAAGGLHHTD